MKLPARWQRRILLWPLPLVLVWFYVASVPLLFIVALPLSFVLPGKLRAVRVLGLATVYAFVEVAIIISSFGLWILSGFGALLRTRWFLDAHYRLLGWALRTLVASGRRLFVLDLDVERADPGDDGLAGGPLIAISRHAGPADSILVMHELIDQFGRRPRIVLKDTLQWDPAFDILLHRIPAHFVTHAADDRQATLDGITELARTMGPNDAFVIFPEGGNFTEHRRKRSIEFFLRAGRHREAERAGRLRHVLPPRPDGTLAALDACPDAQVMVIAHTGLDELYSVADVWDALPDHKTLQMLFAVVPDELIPSRRDDRIDRLWAVWERIDGWIDEHRHRIAGT